jgi:CHAT domain-containing protein/tetratricopeptide (TPR) repeat protein
MRVRKALLEKAAPISLISLAVSAALLIASASPAFAQSQDAAKRAEALFQDALISCDAGDRASVRLRLEEAIRLWSQINQPAKAAKAALMIGDRFKQAGQYHDALDYYYVAQKLKSLPSLLKANVYHSFALVYAELYQSDLASRNFNLALNLARAANDPYMQMTVLTGQANFYHRQGDVEKSLECITQALRLSKKAPAIADPALLYLQGRVSQEEGLVDKAKAAYEEALAIFRQSANIAGQVRVLCAISNLALLSSQKQAALEQAVQAVELADKQAKRSVNQADRARASELQWLAWLSRARAERLLKQNERARKSYLLALNRITSLWWAVHIATEASAIAFREEAQAAYRELVDLLVELGQLDHAYGWAESAKARAMLNVTVARRAATPFKDSRQEAFLRERSQAIARLRLQLLSSNITPAQEAKLEKEIEDAEYEMLAKLVQDEIADLKDRLVWSPLATAEQLRKQIADNQMTLVQFSLGENRSFVWLFTRGEVHFAILPARKEIEREVRTYLQAIAAAPNHLFIDKEISKARAKGEAIFKTLFGSLSTHLEPGRRLIVVPDGLLYYLPFEALVHNGHYLVEDHEISYNPSASLLGLWEGDGGRSGYADQMELLAIGDPVFEAYSRKRNGARQSPVARGFGLTQLPKTREEVQHISDLFPTDRRKMLIGKESTEAAIKREPLRRYRRLHFATHSLIDEQSPWRSGVVLTSGGEEDGFLDVREISRLDLDCDLVVVSACQTGRGKLLSGEGVIGLSRAFLYAGARSVIVSLWNVTDISTGRLMKSFYQHVTGGLSNAAALRRAKLQMIGDGKVTRHPYYWSSFVMIGKP